VLTKNQKIDIMHNVPSLRGMRKVQRTSPRSAGYSRLLDNESRVADDGSIRNSVATLENSQPVLKVKKSDYDISKSPLRSIARDLNDRVISEYNQFGQSMGPHAKNSNGFTEVGFHFDDIVGTFADVSAESAVGAFWDELDRCSNRLGSRVKLAS